MMKSVYIVGGYRTAVGKSGRGMFRFTRPDELGKQVIQHLMKDFKNLDKDRKFLTAGEVFTDDQIDAYIDLKFQEIYKFEHTPHPIEFEMYYSQ